MNTPTPAMPSRLSRLVLVFIFSIACCLGLSRGTAQVINHTFEDGTTQGWGPRGPVSVAVSSEVARSGSLSLKTTGRTASWNGPAVDLRTKLALNATYQVTGWVRLVAGQPASPLKFTLERKPVNGDTTYSQIGGSPTVTDGAWVQLQGNLTLPADDNAVCTLYVESTNATVAYHLDDFTVTALSATKCPEPHDQSGLLNDWESGGNQGWSGRGSAVLANVDTTAHGGSRSLEITGRTASWNGASINALCKLHKGSKYLVSVWARLLPGEPASELRLSLQASLGGNVSYMGITGNTPVTDGAWVNITSQFTFSSDVDQLQLYIESASGTASFYIDDFALVHVPALPIQTNIPSLKDVLAPYFPIGAAIEPGDLAGTHLDLLKKHYNQFTAGNSMKWDATEPGDGVFNFTRADALANFARANSFRMRGHTLLWHAQNPGWLFLDGNGNALQPGNPAHRTLLLQRLERHIQTVVTRYRDIVDAWDVVNEVIDPNQPGGLRNSPWLQIIGPDYIDHAFHFAHQHAGGAALYINDYSTTDTNKRAALKNVVQGLLDRGVPVHGVGHQMHISVVYPPLNDIRTTLELFAGMGLINEITEMDVSAYTNDTDIAPVSAQVLAQQGYRYRDIFNIYRELSPVLQSVTLWGLGDDTSWLKTFPITRDDKPLPFDEQSQAKPAYWGIVDPTQLPIVPKALTITQANYPGTATAAARWESFALQPLTSVITDTGWARFRAGWKGSEVYLQVLITDATRDAGDAIDVFLGGASYRFSGLGMTRTGGASGLIQKSQKGYTAYITVPAGQMLSPGDNLKFDVRVTDGSSNAQVSWSDTKNNQNNSLESLGTLTLAPERKLIRTRRGTPVIDGVMDSVWSKAEEFQTGIFVAGNAGATARTRTLWDENYLYIYTHVSDPLLSKASPNVWEQDSVELFVDSNNGQTSTYQSDDAQYRVNYENLRTFGGAATADKITSAVQLVPGGYVVECAISLAAVPVLPVKSSDKVFVGFDIQVNDDGAGNGIRSSVATWNDTSGNNYLNTTRYGVLQLVPQN